MLRAGSRRLPGWRRRTRPVGWRAPRKRPGTRASTLDDIFEFQDRITDSVIGLIEPQIQRAEIERARQKRPESFDAWDLYVQAVPLVFSPHVANYDTAIPLLHRAIALEPNYCPALATASWAHERRRTYGGPSGTSADDERMAFAFAQRAVEADPNDALALANLGWQRILFKSDFSGVDMCERAVSLNPLHRAVLELAAIAHLCAGDLDKLMLYAHRGLDLSPGAPDNFEFATHVASAHFQAGRFEEAATWSQRSIDLEPGYFFAYAHLAMSLACLGRIEEGHRVHAAARAVNPHLSFIPSPPTRYPERQERWLVGARLLGLVP